jgi:hypothetical protein
MCSTAAPVTEIFFFSGGLGWCYTASVVARHGPGVSRPMVYCRCGGEARCVPRDRRFPEMVSHVGMDSIDQSRDNGELGRDSQMWILNCEQMTRKTFCLGPCV